MKRILALLTATLLLTGCGTLLPKRVELGQDKVQIFPEPKAAEKETQRQAAQMAHERASETLEAALRVNAPPSVVVPAQDTEILSDAVAESVGPPVHPAPVDKEARAMAAELRTAIAKLSKRLDEFKAENNENAGKKIEGTGFLQIPYFLWIALVMVFGFVGLIVLGVIWSAVKVYGISNPPVALGVKAVQTGGKLAATAVGQLIAGGEKFKAALESEIKDPVLLEKIKSLFRTSHETAQDEAVKGIVKELT